MVSMAIVMRRQTFSNTDFFIVCTNLLYILAKINIFTEKTYLCTT